MSDYTPPDALNVILNFTKESTFVDSHNVILNFGAEDGFNYANISIDLAFQVSAVGTVEPPIDVHGTANIPVDTSLFFGAQGTFDINHILGISINLSAQFEKAVASLSVVEIPWSKPILRVSNEALFFDKSLVVSSISNVEFNEAILLSKAVRILLEKATGLSSNAYMVWEEGDKRFIHQRYVHQDTIKLRHSRELKWQEMIRRRKQFTYSHEVAEKFEKRFSFEWDKGLEIVTKSELPWDKAKSIHYRKHPVQPWPKPELPKYEGSGDLNFVCLCHDVDSHNVILNFGADDCIPALPKKNWWYIVNNLSAERLDNGETIKVINGTYNCSRSTWCWSYSITVAHTEKEKLQPINGRPVILKLMINGFEHHVLLETETETIKFANKSYTYDGRSVTALNAADYAAKRSFIQDNERTSVQLVQTEIDRAQSGTELDWKLIDDVGWIVPVESLSYAELAPMDAIKQVVEVGGGFIYSQKSGNTLSILPLYKNGYWDAMTVDDYDILISQSIVIQQTIEQNKDYIADCNAINVVNSRSGDSLTVKQRNTAGDIPLEAVTGPMFDVVSGASFGKMELIKANIQEFHTLSGLPVSQEIGEMLPGKTVAFDGQWWGIIDSVSGSFNHGKVTESIKVERIHRD
ncbi:hypothetical protein [Acinetobacter sp. ANC 5600]|uniref:hypothetical protein n=1 Tax=Acinetobacter sp. ANC 5600 TaxID=1960940 RepID=UPI0009919329|nr:hypothetical protein [Acinetobacter sp. ANC 5600]OOV81389.1 hypothetical protein B1201_09950 [Acinetobacter sp. ANC 5600]